MSHHVGHADIGMTTKQHILMEDKHLVGLGLLKSGIVIGSSLRPQCRARLNLPVSISVPVSVEIHVCVVNMWVLLV